MKGAVMNTIHAIIVAIMFIILALVLLYFGGLI